MYTKAYSGSSTTPFREDKCLTNSDQAIKKILIVEDDTDIAELVAFHLKRAGYAVKAAFDGLTAWDAVGEFMPDLIVLDIMLPGQNGFMLTRKIRENKGTLYIPIIMLTARSDERDIIRGFELGADDYVTKPFSKEILLARIKAVLGRVQSTNTDAVRDLIERGNLLVSIDKRDVQVDGAHVKLSSFEFEALVLLAKNPGRIFTRYQLIDNLHGENHPVTDRSVDVMISSLRSKLRGARDMIETVRGIGYRFREEI
ncbi:MAG TPA: response regulator transcription factor [Caldisericia bacterium]|nr:response regulator transcription factor [Caldisericia bacterium]HPI84367.1 response regulator transcription factor [Caldisericia bacterium]